MAPCQVSFTPSLAASCLAPYSIDTKKGSEAMLGTKPMVAWAWAWPLPIRSAPAAMAAQPPLISVERKRLRVWVFMIVSLSLLSRTGFCPAAGVMIALAPFNCLDRSCQAALAEAAGGSYRTVQAPAKGL